MSKSDSPSPAGPIEPPASERLESWKEIASYLKREVRTVQRWEKTEGLPVHRHLHDKLGSVYAFSSELDAWRKQRQPVLDAAEEDAEEPVATREGPKEPVAVERPRQLPRPLVLLLGFALLAVLILAMSYLVRDRISNAPHPRASKIKLMVRPFQNLTGSPEKDYITDGMTDEMITQLGRLQPSRLVVIARTTSMLYKGQGKSLEEIGSDLGVDYVLEGTVRSVGDRFRISAQLIELPEQTTRWAETYDRELKDLLVLERDVAQAITGEIQLVLTPQEQERVRLAAARVVDPVAYQAYLKGLYYWNKRTPSALQESVDYFQQAIQKDPNDALAYAGLANAYTLLGTVPYDAIPPREAMPKAKTAATKSLQLDDSLAEGHASLALVRSCYDWDLRGAEQEYKRALDLSPANATARQWYSLVLTAMGRLEEAREQIRLAQELDPRSAAIRQTLAESYYFSRQHDRVIEESRKTLKLDPNFFEAHYYLGRADVSKGKYAEAFPEFEKAILFSGESPAAFMGLGHAYAVAGNREKALETIERLKAMSKQRYVPSFYLAAIYTGLGDKDKAFELLDAAYQERTDRMILLGVEPMADPLVVDPRFQKLLRRIGVPTQPAAAPASAAR